MVPSGKAEACTETIDEDAMMGRGGGGIKDNNNNKNIESNRSGRRERKEGNGYGMGWS